MYPEQHLETWLYVVKARQFLGRVGAGDIFAGRGGMVWDGGMVVCSRVF